MEYPVIVEDKQNSEPITLNIPRSYFRYSEVAKKGGTYDL
jgi:hypothetical protein